MTSRRDWQEFTEEQWQKVVRLYVKDGLTLKTLGIRFGKREPYIRAGLLRRNVTLRKWQPSREK